MTAPYWSGEGVTLHHGDCVTVMAEMPADSIDAICTDPPYGLGFMGKAWDDLPPGLDWAKQCIRVLKPGGHLLAFGGTRTWHRLAVAVEDAGFEIRDSIAWLYGSGFPKSLDVSKAIDKSAGATREIVGEGQTFGKGSLRNRTRVEQGYRPTELMPEGGAAQITVPATAAAKQWQGFGTALKPAFEPIVVARKPLAGTVAGNVLAHGTGALNIDGCRIGDDTSRGDRYNGKPSDMGNSDPSSFQIHKSEPWSVPAGRWPANVTLDTDQAAALDKQSGVLTSGALDRSKITAANAIYGAPPSALDGEYESNSGGASRFFYVAKAPTAERPRQGEIAHPTVKPIDLMQWLVRLVTPPGGVVLDPFAGSGTTGEAAVREGFTTILIEREADYLPLIRERFRRPINYLLDFDAEATRADQD